MSRLHTTTASNQALSLDPKAWIFALATAFISTMGEGLIAPVVPFLVQRFTGKSNSLALTVGLLVSVYAMCVFLAAPALGLLSDRYGRRPILIFCLLGTVFGYLLFGFGGALWILFLGRIIDGLTGANVGTLFAYVADLTPPEKRGQYYGKIGAMTGVGFIFGPLIGGVSARFGYSAPLFVGATITFVNVIWGYFFMPESLDESHRMVKISMTQLNPLKQLKDVLALTHLRWLLIALFLLSVPFVILESNLAVLAKEALNWQPSAIGALLFIFGIQDIFVQGVLVQRLLPVMGDTRVAQIGMSVEIAAYLCIAFAAGMASSLLLTMGMILFGFGEPLMGPSLGGLISRMVDSSEQGRLQGSNQALRALAGIVGPIFGGQLYASTGGIFLYISAAGLVALSMGSLRRGRVYGIKDKDEQPSSRE